MATLDELGGSKVSVTVLPKESIIQCFVKDAITFSMVAFCVYISQGSTWWTFVTGGAFLFIAFARLQRLISDHVTVFKGKDDAIKYLTELDT